MPLTTEEFQLPSIDPEAPKLAAERRALERKLHRRMKATLGEAGVSVEAVFAVPVPSSNGSQAAETEFYSTWTRARDRGGIALDVEGATVIDNEVTARDGQPQEVLSVTTRGLVSPAGLGDEDAIAFITEALGNVGYIETAGRKADDAMTEALLSDAPLDAPSSVVIVT